MGGAFRGYGEELGVFSGEWEWVDEGESGVADGNVAAGCGATRGAGGGDSAAAGVRNEHVGEAAKAKGH